MKVKARTGREATCSATVREQRKPSHWPAGGHARGLAALAAKLSSEIAEVATAPPQMPDMHRHMEASIRR